MAEKVRPADQADNPAVSARTRHLGRRRFSIVGLGAASHGDCHGVVLTGFRAPVTGGLNAARHGIRLGKYRPLGSHCWISLIR